MTSSRAVNRAAVTSERVRLLLAVVLAAVLWAVCVEWAGAYSPEYLTDNAYDDTVPRVSFGRIAWVGEAPGDSEIWTWAPGDVSPFQVTVNTVDDTQPEVSADRIAWVQGTLDGQEIYTWEEGDGGVTRITDNATADRDPVVSGDRIAWQGWDGGDWEIYTRVVGSGGITQVTDNDFDDTSPSVYGSRLAWEGDTTEVMDEADIYTWVSGDAEPTQLTDRYYNARPQIYGDVIAWSAQEWMEADGEILVWQVGDAEPTQVTDNDYEDAGLSVWGDRLAWRAWPDGSGSEILTWELGDGAPTRVTRNSYMDYAPTVWEDRLVWKGGCVVEPPSGCDTTKLEVFTWNVGDCEPTRITDDALEDGDPVISGNEIVWTTDVGGDTEIRRLELVPVTRLSGSTRYTTALEISKQYPPLVDGVVLATGANFPDALCAAPLAQAYGGPILLVPPTGVARDGATVAELKRLMPDYVFIVGGDDVVPASVESTLGDELSWGPDIIRLEGPTRYETCAAVAARLKTKLGARPQAIVATGKNFPDALSAGPLAAKHGLPILLVPGDSIPSVIGNVMTDLGVSSTLVVGGTDVVSSGVQAQLPAPTRLQGPDRFATCVAVATYADTRGLTFKYTGVATGLNFPDALAAGPRCGDRSGVLLLTRTDALPGVVEGALAAKADGVSRVEIYGGCDVVRGSVQQRLGDVVN